MPTNAINRIPYLSEIALVAALVAIAGVFIWPNPLWVVLASAAAIVSTYQVWSGNEQE